MERKCRYCIRQKNNMKITHSILLEKLNSGRVVLVGYGLVGKEVYRFLQENGFECVVCDNYLQKTYTDDQKLIVSPREAAEKYGNCTFVITVKKYCYELQEQMVEYGVLEEHIICMDDAYFCECRKLIPEELYPALLEEKYERELGESLNIENPKTFNEYIIHEMLYKVTDLKRQLVDKYRVREWVRQQIGEQYLVSLLGVWENADDIDFEKLPERFVLKANHGCGWNIIVRDKRTCNEKLIKRKLNSWLKTDFSYAGFELQYRGLKPVIICEEYMENKNCELDDYKVFCMNGKPQYIMYLTERSSELKMAFYDTKWNKQPFVYTYKMLEREMEKPDCLEKLLELSEQLCSSFEQVRIDWYVLNDGTIKFGEMTFSSCAGMAKWNPPEWNAKLGGLLWEK